MNKDLVLAGSILVICLIILVAASNEPARVGIADLESGPEIASLGSTIPGPGQEGQIPSLDDDYDIDEMSDTSIDSDLSGLDEIDEIDDTFDTGDLDTPISVADLDDQLLDDPQSMDEGDDTPITIITEFPEDADSAMPEVTRDTEDTRISFSDDDVAVASTAAAPLGTSGGDHIHTVATGDILGSISQKWYGTTRYWKTIRDTNDVYENELQVGQRLIIPEIEGARSSSAPVAAVRERSLESGQRMYTVKRGDSYYMIAQRELGDSERYKEIQALNGTSAYELMPDTQIILPAASAATRGVSVDVSTPAIAGARTHVIAGGETLSDISVKYYGTSQRWREIAAANGNINPSRLMVGAKLQIPQAGSKRSVQRVGSSSRIRSPAGAQQYVIRRGDTLGEISQKFYGTVQKWKLIQRANSGLNPNKMIPGKKITIPASNGRVVAPVSRPGVERIGGGEKADFGGI
ncbi:MAG: LysM peptidoglycan-binding domain-containing protein [Planctomycetes bacterium]|nr:LysM peptidoglycan-binding domain-containing protein [Planctomycetota bacterium]